MYISEKKGGLGHRELLDVIRSKPVLKKKLDLTLDQIKLYKIFQNLDGIAIFSPTKKKNLLGSNDPPETELSYDIRYVTRGYVSHSESIPE